MDYVLNKLDDLRERVEGGEADREEIGNRLNELERSLEDFIRPYIHEFQARWKLLEKHLGIQMYLDETDDEWKMEQSDGG